MRSKSSAYHQLASLKIQPNSPFYQSVSVNDRFRAGFHVFYADYLRIYSKPKIDQYFRDYPDNKLSAILINQNTAQGHINIKI